MKVLIVLAAIVALSTAAYVPKANGKALLNRKPVAPTRGVVKAECGGFVTASNGTIASPNYPENYDNDAVCDWFLTGDADSKIRLTFDDIETEFDYDFVIVRDGFSANSPVLFVYSGPGSNIVVESTGNRAFVGFSADYSYPYRGFHATWESVPLSE